MLPLAAQRGLSGSRRSRRSRARRGDRACSRPSRRGRPRSTSSRSAPTTTRRVARARRRRRAGRPARATCARSRRSSRCASSPSELAGGGDLEELRAQLAQVRMIEQPPGIEEAEEAALALERVIGAPPRVASPALPRRGGRGDARARAGARARSASPFASAIRVRDAAPWTRSCATSSAATCYDLG